MRILVSGGGTGGHITPILAVAYELKKQQPECQIIYVGEKQGKFGDLMAGQVAIDSVYTVSAGKFRRYYRESWIKRLGDVKTNFLNVRDIFRLLLGTFQAIRLIRRVKPDVVFLKGGFVGVPVGLAAVRYKIPFITHDSDAVPGLANRIVSRWARIHATGMPTEFYSYPKEKTRYVGVLVNETYQPVTAVLQQQYRRKLGLPTKARVLVVTGGSLGAQRLNEAISKLAPTLAQKFPDLHIIHQVGKGNLNTYLAPQPKNLTVLEFMSNMECYLGAADVVVTRAGANTLAELGIQGKACVVVPNPFLTGGHQVQNAKYLADHQAVIMIPETALTNPTVLQDKLTQLLEYPEMRAKLGKTLQTLTKPNATQELAKLILELGASGAK